MKRILITGANSYIGTSFEEYMSQWPDKYRIDTIDMVDGSWRGKSFVGYNSVFHVAGIAHIDTRKLDQEAQDRYWEVNAELPFVVANRAKAECVRQFIFLSSMSVYGEHGSIKSPVIIDKGTKPNPKDLYGRSKLHAEEKLELLSDTNYMICILRPPMVYGPGCKGNYITLKRAALKLPVFPDIWNRRSMLHIDNLTAFLKQLVDQELSGLYFPQDPAYICTSEMVRQIAKDHGRKIYLTKGFNSVLKGLSGRIKLIDKVFGSLVYQDE